MRQLVDLAISQQLSEAVPSADTSLAGSPTILNRQISTSLTLRDGGSLLMGGLISGSAGATGVPVRAPVLGRLFRTDAVQADRTELMVMVTPYVIATMRKAGNSPADSGAARSAHRVSAVRRI